MEQISLRAAPKPLLTSTANESPARRYSHGISRSYVACIRQFSSLSTRRRESWKSTQMSFVTKNSTTFWKTCRHAWQMSLKQHQWLGVKSVNVHHVLAKMLHFGWHEIIISNPKSEPSEYKVLKIPNGRKIWSKKVVKLKEILHCFHVVFFTFSPNSKFSLKNGLWLWRWLWAMLTELSRLWKAIKLNL